MARGYVGKILCVDLSSGGIDERPLDEDMCREFIGGYGLAARLTYDWMRPGVDPLGRENVLGFMTGPATGTEALQANRFVVTCKSPLTGGWGDANAGGGFGPGLKAAGFDGAFFFGIADQPVYLCVQNGRASLEDATWLWGRDCYDSDDLLKERHGKGSEAAVIGPPGERQALLACVVTDKGRVAGRQGVGAVMGSKRLKAVVVSGTSALEVHDAQKVRELRKAFIQRQGKEYKRFQKWGTLGLLQWSAETGDSPVKNWRGSGWDDFGEGIDAFEREKLFKYKTGRYGCWRCNLACGGHMEVKEGEARSTWTHLVEYESACSLGTACLISDFVSIIKATEIVNRAGLDSISAGCAVAFAMDCYEAGILSKEDLGGLGLSWGNAEAMLALVEQMAAGEGLGGLLSMGVKRAAERIGRGAEHYAIHVGGQEVPMHDPRFTPGLATSYQMDATPARHTQGAELLQPVEWDEKFPADKHQYGGKGIVTARASSLLHVVQAAGLCLFGHLSYPVDYLPAFLTAITGWDFSLEECYRAGERIAQLRHAFNLREGINPIMHHQLPGIVYGNPPLEAGELKGITLDVKAQRDDYCEAMGWDKRTAQPGAQRLRDLNLGFLIPDIAQPAGQ